MRLTKGARPVPVDSSSSRDPGRRLSTISVPVALRPTRMVSPSRMSCRRRGQRTVRNLDAEEFEGFLVMGARHAVGAQERPAIDLKAHHGKLAAQKPKPGSRVGGEAEQGVRPVAD